LGWVSEYRAHKLLSEAARTLKPANARFILTDVAERQDNCANVYRRSLLYLVSNAFEHQRQVPLLGMQKFVDPANLGLLCQFPRVHNSSRMIAGRNVEKTIQLKMGESVVAKIDARPPNNATGIRLEIGSRYELVASGIWFDAGHGSGPEGYEEGTFLQNLFTWLRRAPNQNWFALIGSVDAKEKPFLIGRHLIYECCQEGELICFANDVPGFYWNNTGSINLRICRIV
jgi:hypothetical protein